MKKIYLALIIALMYILGVTASAEESGYTPGVNSYTSSMLEGAKSVIIYKGTDRSDIRSENIYYIDQADSAEGFANLELLMKLDAPAGTYTVVVDGIGAATITITDYYFCTPTTINVYVVDDVELLDAIFAFNQETGNVNTGIIKFVEFLKNVVIFNQETE